MRCRMGIKMFGKKDNEEKEKGLFNRLKDGLSKTRACLTERLDQLILGKRKIDEELLEEIEEILDTTTGGHKNTASQDARFPTQAMSRRALWYSD